MTSREVADVLARAHWSVRKHVIVPNVSWGLGIWEADLLVLHQTGWADEVEIKVSKADFKREFIEKAHKHECLVKGEPAGWRGCYDWSKTTPGKIRRYWMAFPLDLARELLDQVPAHAGVLGVVGGGFGKRHVSTLRDAPILKHSRKLTDAEQVKLLRLAYLRYWDIRHLEREAA